MARRTWTDQQKTQALDLYVDHGAAHAEARTGIPAATIRSWAHRNGLAARCNENRRAQVEATKLAWAERRGVMVEEIGAAAHMALAQTVAALEIGRGRDAKDLATTMAILVDKAQLLAGDPTVRQATFHEAREEVVADARRRALELVPRAV